MSDPIRPSTLASTGAAPLRSLQQTLRDVGLLLIPGDVLAAAHTPAPALDVNASNRSECALAAVHAHHHAASADWLRDLFVRSRLFLEALQQVCEGDSAGRAARPWAAADDEAARELFPGCWVVGLAGKREARRRRSTSCRDHEVAPDVAVILTEAFLDAEQLVSMCQSARLDLELCRRLLRALPLASRDDVQRLTRLIRMAHADDMRWRADSEAMENVGQQLAESYEEINLLYSIIQSMTLEEQPERFLQFVCEELLATMSYSWIGIVLKREFCAAGRQGRFTSLAERLIVAGVPRAPLEQVRVVALKGLERVRADAPMVLEPAFNPEHAVFEALGHNALVQPVKQGEKVVGVLIAGGKRGADLAVSSVDMKLVNATATHVSIFLENASLYDNLNAMFIGTLEALTASIDAKDRYTCGHSQRVAHLTRALAASLGQDDVTLKRMHIAGLVHDVGKIGVPESVLLKPGRLTPEEFAWIRLHPEIGYRILKDIPQLNDVLPGVLHHHERWDGHGYPHGLAGEAIPLIARLIALADSFDAMSSSRTYRKAMSRPMVLEEIRRNSGTQFDPHLVPAFVSLDFSEYDRLVREHRATELMNKTSPGAAA